MQGIYVQTGITVKPVYALGAYTITWNDENGWWRLGLEGNDGAWWKSTDDVETPDLVETWQGIGATTGTPIITLVPASGIGDTAPPISPEGGEDLAPATPGSSAGAGGDQDPAAPGSTAPAGGGNLAPAAPGSSAGVGGDYSPGTPAPIAPVSLHSPPVNLTLPSIPEDGVVGHTITVNPGAWKYATGVFSYQWQIDGVDVLGATAITMTIPSSGSAVTCEVTATNPIGSSIAETAPADFLWPVKPISGDYVLLPEDRKVVLSFSEATIKTVQVGGILPGEFVVIEQRGWGRTTLVVDQDTLELPDGKTASLAGDGARVMLSCTEAGTIEASGDLEDIDPIRQACGEENILLDLDGSWGVVRRPATEPGKVETWFCRNGGGRRTKPTFPRENKYYLRIFDHPTAGQTLQTGIAGSSIFPATIVGLPDVPQPFTVIAVVAHIDANTAPVLYDATSTSLIGQQYYYGYDLNAGVYLTDGGPNNPRWDYQADGTAAPNSLMAVFDGASSKLYIDNWLKSSGDAGTNGIDGSTLTIGGDARNGVIRIMVLSGPPADAAAIMAAVLTRYGIPTRP